MKQPSIKIFGKIHKVMQIEFNKDGELIKIVYQVGEYENKTVFKSDEMSTKSLISTYKIKEPTHHPYYDYAYAPHLEKLIIHT